MLGRGLAAPSRPSSGAWNCGAAGRGPPFGWKKSVIRPPLHPMLLRRSPVASWAGAADEPATELFPTPAALQLLSEGAVDTPRSLGCCPA